MGRLIKRATKRVPEDERRIGLRIAYLRRDRNMRQADLAARLGLTRAQLSTIEAGRVALRLQTGWNICKLFDVYPGWLETGYWPLAGERTFPPLGYPFMAWVERMIEANKQTLFSKGWPEIGKLFDEPHGELRGRARFIAAQEKENASQPQSRIGIKKSKLIVDTLSDPGRMAGVTSETGYWEALVKRVRAFTSALGQKAQLARELNTTRQAVNKWLSGTGAPSAEITLRLLNWVNQQEQKPNTPGGDINTTKGKTQSKASNEKKPRSNPSKR